MDIKDLTFEKVDEICNLLKQMGEKTTPQNLAKELGVKSTEMMRFLNEGKYHFRMTTWTYRDKKWVTVDKVFINDIDNPRNPEWLSMMKTRYAKMIYFKKVEWYGVLLGWKLEVDLMNHGGYGWRNTKEKVKAIEDAGLLTNTCFSFGGIFDSWSAYHLGFKPEDKDTVVQNLKNAGWQVHFED